MIGLDGGGWMRKAASVVTVAAGVVTGAWTASGVASAQAVAPREVARPWAHPVAAHPVATSPVLGTPLAGEFRLRVLPAPDALPDRLDGRVQRGFGGSMVDYYPFGDEGFHLSAGGRMAPRAAGRKDEAGRLLYAPRQAGVRASRRMNPAVTMGYSRVVQDGVTLGIEGGMMVGSADPALSQRINLPRAPRMNGANQLVRMAMGVKF